MSRCVPSASGWFGQWSMTNQQPAEKHSLIKIRYNKNEEDGSILLLDNFEKKNINMKKETDNTQCQKIKRMLYHSYINVPSLEMLGYKVLGLEPSGR